MRKFKLYTDGSHFKPNDKSSESGRLGIGAILVNSGGSVVDSMSMEVDRTTIRETYQTSDVSNPTMEMYAVLIALRRFSSRLNFGDEIEVFADYQGVMYWMYHKWRINKPYIYMIREDIEAEVKKQELSVKYNWVKGHNGDSYNELVDKLAKGEILKV